MAGLLFWRTFFRTMSMLFGRPFETRTPRCTNESKQTNLSVWINVVMKDKIYAVYKRALVIAG